MVCVYFNLTVVTPTCPADLNESGTVDAADLLMLLAEWGPCEGTCLGDLDGDDIIGVDDLLMLLAEWGMCP
jgi:hypothetical protein